jgi:BlaI family transcriptional regulator, penicillinase repressor
LSTVFAVDNYGKTSNMPRVIGKYRLGHGGTFSMSRPRHEQPTPAELAILKVLWTRTGPTSVRDVLEALNHQAEPRRAYTSVMSLLNVMTVKGLLRRSLHGRAFLYEPVSPRDHTLRSLLSETLKRVYNGSASLLVAHLLDQSHPSGDELDQIRTLLDEYQVRHAKLSKEGETRCKPLQSKRSKD